MKSAGVAGFTGPAVLQDTQMSYVAVGVLRVDLKTNTSVGKLCDGMRATRLR